MKQQRKTRQRQLVLDAVRGRTDHPTAEQIFTDVQQHDPRISRGTVYRNLNLLSRNGEILQLEVPGSNRFDLRTEGHSHLLCVRCGKVSDAPLPYQPRCDALLSAETGYRILRHNTVFEGVCPDCQGSA